MNQTGLAYTEGTRINALPFADCFTYRSSDKPRNIISFQENCLVVIWGFSAFFYRGFLDGRCNTVCG